MVQQKRPAQRALVERVEEQDLVSQPSAPYECDGRGLRPRVRRASEWCKKDAQRRMAIVASTSSSLITSMCININTNIDSRRGLRRRSQQRGDMQVGLPRVRLPTREGGAAIRTMWAWIAASYKLEF
jgi:hypothetical protein